MASGSPFTSQTLSGLSTTLGGHPTPILWMPHQGRVEERSGNTPLMLDDPDSVFFVEKGSADVFSVPSAPGNGQPGARRFLWTAMEGDVLFGFPSQGVGAVHVLMAVCAPGSRLRRMPFADVEARAREEEWVFVSLIEGLAARLAGALVLRPELNVVLKPGETVTLERGRIAGTVSGLVWVRQEAGQSRFSGMTDVLLGPDDPPLPLCKGMWLEALSEEASLTTADTATCVASGDAFPGLGRLRSLFGVVVARIAELEDQIERERLERKAEGETEMRSRALTGLVTVLEGPGLEAAVGEAKEPLLRACRVVGAREGISFNAPPSWETSGRVRDPLAAICRASRVRSRRVMLRGEWWTSDAGNLVAFIEKTETPVALVRARTRYDLVDPRDMSRRPVTREVAETLNWEAYTFYRPLPDERVDGRGLIRRIAEEARTDLRFVITMALLAGLLTLLVPMATKRMLGQIVPNALRSEVWTLGLALAGVHVGIALFNLARAFTLVRIEGRSNSSLQGAVVDRMLALPVPFFRDNPVGELAGRALSVNAARRVITGSAAVTLLAGISSILYFILLVYYNWRLALLGLAVILVSLLLVYQVAKRAVRTDRENLSVQGDVSSLVFQMISGIAKLRVSAAEGRLFAKWSELFRRHAELSYRARIFKNVIKVYSDLLPLLSSLALFWVAGYLVRNGHDIDTATFVAFNAAYGALFGALTQFSNTVVDILGVTPIIDRARPILESIPEVEKAKPDPGALTGRIEVDHVTFAYKAGGPLVLDDVSLHALPGEYIAIVGPSGSGKSTLFRMLLGFEDPVSGVIHYDGQDLKAVDLSGVRSQMGVVLQNSRLMKGNVFDNIVGSAPLTMEDAWAAAEMSGLSDDIRDMPMGMHTVVSEGGSNLSGGQQQRLLIARALVRRPRILFFDEATSALDNRVQQQVSAGLDRLNATRVVIAHRLSTIRNADRIYVIDKGKVIESGSFHQLAMGKGMFSRLIARQTL
jgi:NHLM bacteriocin system ABC transporter ATP-binding protein